MNLHINFIRIINEHDYVKVKTPRYAKFIGSFRYTVINDFLKKINGNNTIDDTSKTLKANLKQETYTQLNDLLELSGYYQNLAISNNEALNLKTGIEELKENAEGVVMKIIKKDQNYLKLGKDYSKGGEQFVINKEDKVDLNKLSKQNIKRVFEPIEDEIANFGTGRIPAEEFLEKINKIEEKYEPIGEESKLSNRNHTFLFRLKVWCNVLIDLNQISKLRLRPIEDTLGKAKLLSELNFLTEGQILKIEEQIEKYKNPILNKYIKLYCDKSTPVYNRNSKDLKDKLEDLFIPGNNEQDIDKNVLNVEKLKRFEKVFSLAEKRHSDIETCIREYFDGIMSKYIDKQLAENLNIINGVEKKDYDEAQECLVELESNDDIFNEISKIVSDFKKFVVPMVYQRNEINRILSRLIKTHNAFEDGNGGYYRVLFEDKSHKDDHVVASLNLLDRHSQVVDPCINVSKYKDWKSSNVANGEGGRKIELTVENKEKNKNDKKDKINDDENKINDGENKASKKKTFIFSYKYFKGLPGDI